MLLKEVLDTTDAQSILAAYRRFTDSEKQQNNEPLNEAKLLVVGHEDVGKTSLIKFLAKGETCDPQEKKTVGVDIREKIETHTWAPENTNIILNIWDFGGQLMMHQTHRFFFTERSLYLIVLSDRTEDEKKSAHSWLRTIQSHGRESPVIIVINKSDEGKQSLQLNEVGLKKDYPNIICFHRTSCTKGEFAKQSIDSLKIIISTALFNEEQLKEIHDPIPNSWKRVKNSLEDQSAQNNVLKHSDFIKLCEIPDSNETIELIDNPDEQRALLRLLNKLGVIVSHGLDNNSPAAFKEIVLLNPNWITDAIYKLLNSQLISHQNGEFSRQQMAKILDGTIYPKETYEYILSMMESDEIGLCFEIPNSNHEKYLIPEALTPNEPEYQYFFSDSLRFRFSYDFLPTGLIPRFIVNSFGNLTAKKTLWRTGCLLEAASCPIVVKGNNDKNVVDIFVSGKAQYRRSALSIIINTLEIVHTLFPEAGAEARVPMPSLPEVDVGYNHLLKLESKYGPEHEFEPEDADRLYTVKELLDGIRFDNSISTEKSREKNYSLDGLSSIHMGDYSQINIGESRQNQINSVQNHQSPNKSFKSTVISWPYISIAAGIITSIFILIMILLPSNAWRAYLGLPIGGGMLVAIWTFFRDPKYYYRRLLSYIISFGLAVIATGVSFDAYFRTDTSQGGIRWDGSISFGFYFVWAICITVFVVADFLTNNRQDS
ncbi:COR domain-containing protein [Gimesia aquarii]|nr:COR domain-containing protein [Gimesia aquarii]